MSLDGQVKPVILVIGCTGHTGQLVTADLEKYSSTVTVRYCARRQAQVENWKKDGREAVFLDLDDPKTFSLALFGVDRLFLCTGYTVAMLTQSKTIIDAAKRANVRHIVHLGAFTDRQTTVPHIAWHDLIESYIQASGIAWTHLHPTVFMENLLSGSFSEGSNMLDFIDGHRIGWIAVSDIARVAAVALREGPMKHAGKDYWLSSQALTMQQVAEVLTGVLGKPIGCAAKSTDADFAKSFESSPVWIETWYLASAKVFQQQVQNGELGYFGTVRDDVPFVAGQPSLKLKEWATQYKNDLLKVFDHCSRS